MRYLRRYYWLVVSPIYWYLAFSLLWYASPPLMDGSGPVATLYWGQQSPTATLSEYYQNQNVRLKFLYPYCVAGVIITLLGCGGARLILPRLRLSPSGRFLASVGVPLSLFFLAAAVSDVGTGLGAWVGPWIYSDLFSLAVLVKVTLPMSLSTGLLTLAQRWVDAKGNLT